MIEGSKLYQNIRQKAPKRFLYTKFSMEIRLNG